MFPGRETKQRLNCAQWEQKCYDVTSALTTLFRLKYYTYNNACKSKCCSSKLISVSSFHTYYSIVDIWFPVKYRCEYLLYRYQRPRDHVAPNVGFSDWSGFNEIVKVLTNREETAVSISNFQKSFEKKNCHSSTGTLIQYCEHFLFRL